MHSTADSISKNIIVPVTVDNKQQFSFTISTNKKTVTVEELDYKVRNWLTNNKKLYELMGRHMRRVISNLLKKIKIVFGTICFLKRIWFPLYLINLYIYGDNKTIDASSVKIEVHLTTT
ncbi:exotoxin beta-grasp domain-containing protein [Staphylococcus aureus]